MISQNGMNPRGTRNVGNLVPPPDPLSPLINSLSWDLFGYAQWCLSKNDSRGWMESHYSVKFGYLLQLEVTNFSQRSPLRKRIWSNDGLPKVNLFSWTLAHVKILTTDNPKKKGVASPSRCVMCVNVKESSHHLFIKCSYSKEIWTNSFAGINHWNKWPLSYKEMFLNWGKIRKYSKEYGSLSPNFFVGKFG